MAYRNRVGAVLGNEHPVWHWSEPVDGSTSGRSGGRLALSVDAAGAVATGSWCSTSR